MESLLKVTRENSYNDSGKFKGIHIIVIIFHNNLLPFYLDVWQINNYLAMDLVRRIVNHIGNKDPVIKNTVLLSCKTMIDEDDNDIIKNNFDYFAQFTPGIFGGSSEVDVILSQTKIEL